MSQTWIEKPSILLTESKLLEFIPNNEMTYPEKLNALTRFIIATAIIIALICRELVCAYTSMLHGCYLLSYQMGFESF